MRQRHAVGGQAQQPEVVGGEPARRRGAHHEHAGHLSPASSGTPITESQLAQRRVGSTSGVRVVASIGLARLPPRARRSPRRAGIGRAAPAAGPPVGAQRERCRPRPGRSTPRRRPAPSRTRGHQVGQDVVEWCGAPAPRPPAAASRSPSRPRARPPRGRPARAAAPRAPPGADARSVRSRMKRRTASPRRPPAADEWSPPRGSGAVLALQLDLHLRPRAARSLGPSSSARRRSSCAARASSGKISSRSRRADRLGGGPAEQPLGRRVPRDHRPSAVDGHEGVGRACRGRSRVRASLWRSSLARCLGAGRLARAGGRAAGRSGARPPAGVPTASSHRTTAGRPVDEHHRVAHADEARGAPAPRRIGKK